MQITIIVIITNGRAKSKAGIKSHATMYQYEFIGAIMEMPPRHMHVNVFTGSFSG